MRHLLLALAIFPTAVEYADSSAEMSVYLQHHSEADLFVNQQVTSPDPQETKCLATMVYGEARGEPNQGKIAVAFSAVNRAKKHTVCQVVLKPMQYSIFNNNPALRAAALSSEIEPRQRNEIDRDSWQESLHVAQLVLSGRVNDPTGGATHYVADRVMAAKGYTYPKWTRQYTQVAEIGGHRFFKPFYAKRQKTKTK